MMTCLVRLLRPGEINLCRLVQAMASAVVSVTGAVTRTAVGISASVVHPDVTGSLGQ